MSELGMNEGKRVHRYVAARLSAYVDGEVSHRERRRIESHLASCEACRAELRALRWTVDLLRQTPPVKAPRLFVVREADLVKERPRARARMPLQVTQWATAVVALLFVLVVGVDLLAGRGLPRAGIAPVARGEREMAAVTEVVEEQAVEQQTDQVARAVPDETPPPMPTLEARIEAEAAPAEEAASKAGEPGETPEAPMAMKAPELDATEAMTATEEAGVMLAQPALSPTPAPPEASGGGGAPPVTATAEPEIALAHPAPTEPPEVDLQPEVEAPAPKPTERVLPTPSQWTGEYGLRTLLPQDVLLWRIAEAVLGLALVLLLVAVVWMRSRR
jgi:anti-sigma factor RsiW